MARLIDADVLLHQMKLNKNAGYLTAKKAIRLVDEQPTAYDVDKVAEQLEELKNTPPELQYKDITLQNAIEIVKGGGADERL